MISYSSTIGRPNLSNKIVSQATQPGKRQFKTRLSVQDNVVVGKKNMVGLKEHVPDCPVMTGKIAPFNSCKCGTTNNLHHQECPFKKPVNCGCDGKYEEVVNTSLTLGLNALADHIVDGTNIQITYFEFGLGSTTPTAGDTGTEVFKVTGRKGVVQAFRDTTNGVFKTFLNGSEGNTNSTTVPAGAYTTTVFDVLSGQGSLFQVNSRIRISGGAFGAPEEGVIQSISTDTITMTSAFTTAPTGGETVEELISETTLWGGDAASVDQGTGIAVARTTAFTPRTKADGFGLTTEWRFTFT